MTSSLEGKSILMLGGSRQQVIAIQKAKDLGLRTVLCDYLPDNPGQYYADVFYQESTTDKKKMLEIARAEKVSGVLAYSSDPASPTAGYVAEALGLPTNPLSAITTMSEKHLFRAFMRDAGLPCPQAVSFAKDVDLEVAKGLTAKLQWPIVVKPTDSSGSKGVSKVDNPISLSTAIHRAAGFSRNGILIAEEYIQRDFPYVIGGDIFVVDGTIRFWGMMSCLRDKDGSMLVPTGKKIPSGLSKKQYCIVKDVLQRMVTNLGVRFGELNIEIMLGSHDVPYVIELASRAGGNMIPVELSDASGKDLVAANVLAAMGEDPGDIDWDSADADSYIATYVLHSNRAGEFGGIEYNEAIKPYVYREVPYVKVGDKVEAFDGANKALGIVFLRFDNQTQMNTMLSRIANLIRPIVESAVQ